MQVSTMTKLISTILGIVIIIMSISRLISIKITNPQDYILCVHFILFTFVLILSEFQVEFVTKNFQWCSSLMGRGVFLMFFGTLMISTEVFTIVVVAIMEVIGIFYITLAFKQKREASYKDQDNIQQPQIKIEKQGERKPYIQ